MDVMSKAYAVPSFCFHYSCWCWDGQGQGQSLNYVSHKEDQNGIKQSMFPLRAGQWNKMNSGW